MRWPVMNATTQSLDQVLAHSAGIFLNDLLQLRAGEDVLVYFDQNSDRRVAHAVAAQAEQQGHHVDLLELDATLPLAEQAAQLAEYIRCGRFKAICELSDYYFYLTEAWRAAYEIGARVYSIAGLDAESFIRCIGSVDQAQMFALGMALRKLLLTSRRFEVRSTSGTNIRMKFGWGLLDRLAAKIRRGPRAYMTHPSGYRGGFLGGQLAFRGIPHTIEGTAVIDGYLWPPPEIGVLDEPIVLTFKAGKLVEIGGSPEKAKLLTRWFENETPFLEHFCFGFNPGARFTGKLAEAERVFGCLNIGMGSGLSHVDGVMRNPSVYLNGNLILEGRKFITQELATLEGELLRSVRAVPERGQGAPRVDYAPPA
jgi:2,5-dihydroxypyridine 5,6-dioxygenase